MRLVRRQADGRAGGQLGLQAIEICGLGFQFGAERCNFGEQGGVGMGSDRRRQRRSGRRQRDLAEQEQGEHHDTWKAGTTTERRAKAHDADERIRRSES